MRKLLVSVLIFTVLVFNFAFAEGGHAADNNLSKNNSSTIYSDKWFNSRGSFFTLTNKEYENFYFMLPTRFYPSFHPADRALEINPIKLYGRYKDNLNYYYALIDHESVKVIKIVNGKENILTQNVHTPTTSPRTKIAIEMIGDNIKVVIDDILICEVKDGTFESGRVGYRRNNLGESQEGKCVLTEK